MFLSKYSTKINQQKATDTFRNKLRSISIYAITFLILYAIFRVLWMIYPDWTGFRDKTLWDLMELLIVPLVLTGGALWFNLQERNSEKEILTERVNEATLQAYFDNLTDLLLDNGPFDKDFRQNQPEKFKAVCDIARARTLSVMKTLDNQRKRLILDFLYDSRLIINGMVSLEGADLEGTLLSGANFKNSNMNGVKLSKTHLRHADLEKIRMCNAFLANTDFTGANLKKSNLREAYLSCAVLIMVDMEGALLQDVDLTKADLQAANLIGANLTRANLQKANLTAANFQKAKLTETNFQESNLSLADLKGADLTKANLYKAKVTIEQLLEAKSLRDAIMPDGNKHD